MFRINKHYLQLAIYISALLVAVGVFLPLTSLPVYGEVSYRRIAEIESWLVIAFALAAPALILAGKEKFSILSPVAVWGVLLFPAIRSQFESSNETVLSRLGNDLSSAMVDFASDLFFNIAEFRWGGFVFLFALAVFTVSSVIFRFKA